ncbi:pyridoxal phosphate-dependent transferase [Camillea tinctor]|nr:pyridoxal phosphate-dependent transferase [Camillea tinctor]
MVEKLTPPDRTTSQPVEMITATTVEPSSSSSSSRSYSFYVPLFGLALVALITAWDVTSLAIALPTVTQQLHGTTLQSFWASISFILGVAITQPIYVKQEIADFHGAETAYIAPSTYVANMAVLASVPLPGDSIVYDELIHASSHEGFRLSLAEHTIPFHHNDPDGLREVLDHLKTQHPGFEAGTRSVLICVESIYSMDGDLCQLQELVQTVEEEFPLGNAQFIMDEAHSIRVIGDRGRGLVSMLGLEKSIAIRIHATSKAVGSVGRCHYGQQDYQVYDDEQRAFADLQLCPIIPDGCLNSRWLPALKEWRNPAGPRKDTTQREASPSFPDFASHF